MGNSNQAWVPLMRKRIAAAEIEKRLIAHIHSVAAPQDGEEGELTQELMTNSQVTAALGLLKKVLPDLAATEITGAGGEPLFDKVVRQFVEPSAKD